jgi:hypothetical protein
MSEDTKNRGYAVELIKKPLEPIRIETRVPGDDPELLIKIIRDALTSIEASRRGRCNWRNMRRSRSRAVTAIWPAAHKRIRTHDGRGWHSDCKMLFAHNAR